MPLTSPAAPRGAKRIALMVYDVSSVNEKPSLAHWEERSLSKTFVMPYPSRNSLLATGIRGNDGA